MNTERLLRVRGAWLLAISIRPTVFTPNSDSTLNDLTEAVQ